MPSLVERPGINRADEVVPLGRAERQPTSEWDALAGRGFQLHRWFVAAERCGWHPRHLGVRGESGLAAIVPVYLADHGILHDLRYRWLGPLAAAVAKTGLDLRPTITVQSPFSPVSDPLGSLAAASDSALHSLLATLERQAVEDDAVAAVWPFIGADWGERLLRVGQARGWVPVYAGATARLPIRWSSFEEYVASRGGEIRRGIENDLDWLGREGLEGSCTSDFGGYVEQIEQLWCPGFRRRHSRESPVSGFLRALAQPADPAVTAHLTWKAERLVGSTLGLPGRDVLDVGFAGFDAEVPGVPVYFNNLVYLPVRLACARGIAEVDLGPTALYPKVLRGAILRRRMSLIRGTTPACHQLLRAIGEVAGRRQQWKERRAWAALGGTLRPSA
jgi:predicted N-acyltransferase